MWEESWEQDGIATADEEEWEGDEGVAGGAKAKRQREDQRGARRAKLEDEEGVAWGEEVAEGAVPVWHLPRVHRSRGESVQDEGV